MRHRSIVLLASWFAVASPLVHGADVSPVEAFGTVPQIDKVAMSPARPGQAFMLTEVAKFLDANLRP